MNKQEAIEKVNDLWSYALEEEPFEVDLVNKSKVLEIISQIDEPKKPKVLQVAVEFCEKYKAGMLSLDEWFSDFYSKEAIEDFPRMEELADWLHGNDNETNRQRELALATLVTLGIDAVDVEQEKLYTVEIPDPNSRWKYTCLIRNSDGIFIGRSDNKNWKKRGKNQLTESEIKKDFDFLWQFAKEVE